MDYEETKPVVTNTTNLSVKTASHRIKHENQVKQEATINQVMQGPRIELLTKFTKLEFLESCCLLNQSGDSNFATCVHFAKCKIEVRLSLIF